MFTYLSKIAAELDFELVMVTNQDGLKELLSFPEEKFLPVQNFIIKSFENEGIKFSNIFIDKTFAKDNAPTRKPGTGMLTKYLNNPNYDLANSFVIGDRITDMQLAKNLGCKGFWLNNDASLGAKEVKKNSVDELRKEVVVLESPNWKDIYEYLKLPKRAVTHTRNTNEIQKLE